ncbi:MAG: phytanoyl-CoA dioxygenase family protein [Gammaproteobacteria bacterium]|nr:phytanoyl-CoA dioxygenase family protein [Gammaproteobacteria bacterium]MYE82894.1 phytanoyl-CoA dioxygenase family protein [Gammaproteobacteria bacterium]
MSEAISQEFGDEREPALTREQLKALYEAKKARPPVFRAPQQDIVGRLEELGLTEYALQLDHQGYAVVPPERVSTPDFVERVRETVLRVAKERTGVTHELDRAGNPGRYITDVTGGDSYLLFYLLFEDEVFEEWLENPALGAMIDYMLRGQGQLSSMVAFVRWHNPDITDKLTLNLHSDSPGSPEGVLPLGYDLVCNSALVLTPYTKENGALAVVPGSHRLARQPLPGEGIDRAVPVEAEVGSLILWHGGTWHGAFRRTNPGIRLNVTSYHCHRALKTQEKYQWHVPDEMLKRRSARFARILGADDPMGWGAEGPDFRGRAQYTERTEEASTAQ